MGETTCKNIYESSFIFNLKKFGNLLFRIDGIDFDAINESWKNQGGQNNDGHGRIWHFFHSLANPLLQHSNSSNDKNESRSRKNTAKTSSGTVEPGINKNPSLNIQNIDEITVVKD